jgi:hypothetical protein
MAQRNSNINRIGIRKEEFTQLTVAPDVADEEEADMVADTAEAAEEDAVVVPEEADALCMSLTVWTFLIPTVVFPLRNGRP